GYLAESARLVGRGKLERRTYDSHAERLGVFMVFTPTGHPDGRLMHRPARTVGVADLKRLVERMEASGNSPHYINGILRSAKACWTWASRPDPDRDPVRLLPEDTLRGFKGPEIPQAPERYLERAEVARLLRKAWRDVHRWKPITRGRWAACYKRDRPGPCRRGHNAANYFGRGTVLMLRLAYHAGCRPGELCRCTWGDFTRRPLADSPVGLIERRKHKTSRRV